MPNNNEDIQTRNSKSIENRINNKFSPYIKSYEELEGKSVEDLSNYDGITLIDIVCLIAISNANGHHIIGEEKMDLVYFFREPTRSLFQQCEALVFERDMVRRQKDSEKDLMKKVPYANKAMELTNQINALLAQIDEIVLESKRNR